MNAAAMMVLAVGGIGSLATLGAALVIARSRT
jgi:hypothetical protein